MPMDADIMPDLNDPAFETDESPNPVDQRIGPISARWKLSVWTAGILFFFLTTTVSWFRWANFEYRTFDLAYYVQAVWQLIHGRFEVTVEPVPLLGNHVEPVVLLFAPIFALVRHPMLFVLLQNAALATMAPIGYRFARQFFDVRTSALLGIALLLAPAAGYVALHEFHPEALTAPLLLLMIYARSAHRLVLHWVGFLAVLACKENMALLLIGYCLVFVIVDRGARPGRLIRWYGAPLVIAVVWLVACTAFITPAFNSGNIDYVALYDRLGNGPGQIIRNMFTSPRLAATALAQSLGQGNLVWGLVLPFLLLPLLRPRWLVVSLPVLLQHLLSWRSSEWNIYFHYGAPLLPLFWVAAVEAVDWLRTRGLPASGVGIVAPLLLIGCLVGQLWIGPAPAVATELLNQPEHRADRIRKAAFIARIPVTASVTAPLPYLSHLATREKIYSLHYVLKGLKTLSRQPYQPPPAPDFVLIDYSDSATFDPGAGFYHPQMRTADGRLIGASDRLLNDFLRDSRWNAESTNELTLLARNRPGTSSGDTSTSLTAGSPAANPIFAVPGNELLEMKWFLAPAGSVVRGTVDVQMRWRVDRDRQVFPWMLLRMTRSGQNPATIVKGLCAVQAADGIADELWHVDLSALPAGDYSAEALFFDNTRRAWNAAHGRGPPESSLLGPPVSLGNVTISSPAQ